MKITQIQCPSCLGRLEVDWDSGKAVCQYCLNELLIKPELQKTEQKKPDATLKDLAHIQGSVKEGFYPFAYDEKGCLQALKKQLAWQDTISESVFFELELVQLKRVFIPLYYFQIDYEAQVRGAYVHQEQQRGQGRISASIHLHSSGNTTVFSEVFPTDAQKEADYSINGKLPLHIKKGAAYCTEMQQFSAHNQDVQVLPFDISRETALADPHLLEAFEAGARDYLIGTESPSELQLTLFPKHCDTEKLYFPYYIGEFKYGNQTYSFVADGTDAERLFPTQLPECEQLVQVKKSFSRTSSVLWRFCYTFFSVGLLSGTLFHLFFGGFLLPAVAFSLLTSSIVLLLACLATWYFLLVPEVKFFSEYGRFKAELSQALSQPDASTAAVKKAFEARRKKLVRKTVFYSSLENMAYEFALILFLAFLIWYFGFYGLSLLVLLAFVSWNTIRIFTTNSSDRCIETKG
ncbi:hypothetical protein [Enterococcus innesii]|uniref:hypothetical protein n=1 Tax=Enterococcus innesii TaxID=2839759 RepID=UPI00209133BB|nr:hypothetical protein [Enterococcus innesii]MCO5495221.1 hypothetical protein [Enterococcus innesii]